jgi:hypothetical protein
VGLYSIYSRALTKVCWWRAVSFLASLGRGKIISVLSFWIEALFVVPMLRWQWFAMTSIYVVRWHQYTNERLPRSIETDVIIVEDVNGCWTPLLAIPIQIYINVLWAFRVYFDYRISGKQVCVVRINISRFTFWWLYERSQRFCERRISKYQIYQLRHS